MPTPISIVQCWLEKLDTVRVYPEGRDADLYFIAQVPDAADAVHFTPTDAHPTGLLNLETLEKGTWTGERTLTLPDGTAVVFN